MLKGKNVIVTGATRGIGREIALTLAQNGANIAINYRKENEELNPYYKDITERLQGYFGTKVNISNKNNKGKIEIEYYSYEDLQRILDIIKL